MELVTSYDTICDHCGYRYFTLEADQRCGKCGYWSNSVQETADIVVLSYDDPPDLDDSTTELTNLLE